MNPIQGMKIMTSVIGALKGVGGKKVVDLTSREWTQIAQKVTRIIPTDAFVKIGAPVAEVDGVRALVRSLSKDGKVLEGMANGCNGKRIFEATGKFTKAGKTFVEKELAHTGVSKDATVFETAFAVLKKVFTKSRKIDFIKKNDVIPKKAKVPSVGEIKASIKKIAAKRNAQAAAKV